MQTRLLGNTDLNLSVVGLGTWAIGGGDWAFGWGDQDDDQAIAAIKRAVDVGVNWIDTAAVYGLGKSETLVGRAVAEIPTNDRPLIATKCGRTNAGNGQIGKSLQRDSVIAECEASLKRLQIDCIDLYQMHWPQPDEEIEEGWETLVDLKKQGKVRHIGVSNHDVSQLQRLQSIHPVASLQPPYSMISADVETEIMPFCGQNNIGVVCYSPMGKGLLTGGFDLARASSLSANDHRSRDPRFQSPQLEINLEFVKGLNRIATELGWTVAELAIAWVLRQSEVTSAIVGARRPEQIEQTAIAGTRVMSDDSTSEIQYLLSRRSEALDSLDGIEQARV